MPIASMATSCDGLVRLPLRPFSASARPTATSSPWTVGNGCGPPPQPRLTVQDTWPPPHIARGTESVHPRQREDPPLTPTVHSPVPGRHPRARLRAGREQLPRPPAPRRRQPTDRTVMVCGEAAPDGPKCMHSPRRWTEPAPTAYSIELLSGRTSLPRTRHSKYWPCALTAPTG